MTFTHCPLQASQRPPLTLKENCPGLYPLAFASTVWENTSRIASKIPVYVAGLERGVRHIGDWSITMALSTAFNP